MVNPNPISYYIRKLEHILQHVNSFYLIQCTSGESYFGHICHVIHNFLPFPEGKRIRNETGG